MADVKISQLPAATTPLDGTEVLPIVQSATTKQVSISNVTAGRAVAASSLTLTTQLAVTSGGTGLNTTAEGTLLSSTALNTVAATATPTLGVAGTTAGTLTLSGGTSGTVTLKTALAAGTNTIFQFPASNGTNNYILTTNGSGVTDWTNPTALGIDLDVGSTAITGGTTSRVLYNNGGVLGEYAVTGTGSVVLGTTPTFTTSALFPAGTVSAPGISVSGDTNTGVYFPAADNVAIATNGTAALTVDSNQNVSITGVIDGLSTPGTATGTGSTSGGTLAAATYYVRIVAFDSAGNTTNAGTESTGVTTTGSTSSIAYTWTAVTGATGYRVYFSTTSGTYASGYFVTTSASYTLTTTSGSFAVGLPASNTTGISLMPNQSFKRNRIINGDMRVDQRNAGASVSIAGSSVYPVDRMNCGIAQGSGHTAQQSTTAPSGFTNSILITVGTGASPVAGSVSRMYQTIEGLNISDLGWGSASAKTITLSFWVRSSLTGTFAGGLYNSAANRTYVFTYDISSANTFEYKTITIIGDTAGTWLTNNSAGIYVNWDLGSGSTYQGTAGSWAAGAAWATSSSVKLGATSGATFYITGVQLEVGSIATPYERQIYSDQLAQCQRYYTSIDGGLKGLTSSTQLERVGGVLPVPMRSTPTLSLPNGSTGWFDGTVAGTLTAFATNYSSNTSIEFTSSAATGAITGNRPIVIYVGSGNVAASAEL